MRYKLVKGIMLALLLIGMLTLAFNIQPAKSDSVGEVLFFDDFNDGLADGWVEEAVLCYNTQWQAISSSWTVMDGQYFCGYGSSDTGVATVHDLNLADCIIEVKVRFNASASAHNFRAGIVFGYADIKRHYSFELSDEYDSTEFHRYDEGNPAYGVDAKYINYLVNPNTNYQLRVEIREKVFTGYINGQKVLSWTDKNYNAGKVGLRARAADVFFDDFTVLEVEVQEKPFYEQPIFGIQLGVLLVVVSLGLVIVVVGVAIVKKRIPPV